MSRSDTLGIMAAIILAQRERIGGVEALREEAIDSNVEDAVVTATKLLDLVEARESARRQAIRDREMKELGEVIRRQSEAGR